MSSDKSVLIVIAHNNFRDEEFTSVSRKLQDAGVAVTVVSTIADTAQGSQGMQVKPDNLIDDIQAENFDGVVFIGGTGSSQYWHDTKAHDIIVTLNRANKLIAASSHAVVTLAVTGILKERRATAHISVYEKLSVAGAKYTGKKLETDENIITSAGVSAAKEFSDAIIKAITS